jgi:hypothetical protein
VTSCGRWRVAAPDGWWIVETDLPPFIQGPAVLSTVKRVGEYGGGGTYLTVISEFAGGVWVGSVEEVEDDATALGGNDSERDSPSGS